MPETSDVVDSYHSGVGIDAVATTEQAGWVDSPEVLARVNDGLGVVDEVAGAVVRRVGRRFVPVDDLKAYGRKGLLDAARSFKDEGPFSAWARLRIRSAMFDGLSAWGRCLSGCGVSSKPWSSGATAGRAPGVSERARRGSVT